MKLLKLPFLYLLMVVFIIYIISFFFIRHYYSSGLPYYDSVGVYWNMFHIMNTSREGGFISGIITAASYSLSWIQSFFAVLASYILPNSPEYLVLLNFILLYVAVIIMYYCFRVCGYPRTKSFLLSLIPLFFGVLMEWDGGLVDMRREASFIMLLTSLFFLTWIYIWKHKKSHGILLGLIIGLTQWSRGNSLPYIIIIFGSPLLIWILRNNNRSIMSILKLIALPLIVSLLLIVPFYLSNIDNIITKYVYSSWQGGTNRISSLLQFWYIPIALFSGVHKISIIINFIVYFIMLLLCLLLIKLKYIRINLRSKNNKPSMILFSGVLIYCSVFLFNILILGVGKLVGAWPFYPMLVGAFSILGGLLYFINPSLKLKNVLKYKNTMQVIFMTFIIVFCLVRIFYSMPPVQILQQQQAQQASKSLKNILGGKTVAYLWLDHIHVHDLNFYITKEGGLPLNAGSILQPGVDTEMYINKVKSIKRQQSLFYDAIKKREFVVVRKDIKAYENSQSPYFILRFGGPVISRILSDSNYKLIYSFKYGNKEFWVLKNRIYKQI